MPTTVTQPCTLSHGLKLCHIRDYRWVHLERNSGSAWQLRNTKYEPLSDSISCKRSYICVCAQTNIKGTWYYTYTLESCQTMVLCTLHCSHLRQLVTNKLQKWNWTVGVNNNIIIVYQVSQTLDFLTLTSPQTERAIKSKYTFPHLKSWISAHFLSSSSHESVHFRVMNQYTSKSWISILNITHNTVYPLGIPDILS